MTYAEEFTPPMTGGIEEEKGFFEAFGVEFTSKILGVMLAIAGIALGAGVWWFVVKPMQEENDVLAQELQTRQTELQQKDSGEFQERIAQLEDELANEQRIATEILNAYGQDKQMQTFLLDFNRVLTASNVQLTSYEPTPPKPEFISDTTYGEAAQNTLKYQTFNVAFENMTYTEAESMLSSLDRLQPLLVLRNFSKNIAEPATFRYENGRLVIQEQAQLSVSFVVDALIAPTPEELAERQAALAAEAASEEGEETEENGN